MHKEHIKNLKKIFVKTVESIKPSKLFKGEDVFVFDKDLDRINAIKIQGKTVEIGNRSCHLVGFGKAVLGMAACLERILDNRISSGIISIPLGTSKQFSNDKSMQLSEETNIEVYEGAKNNQPDFTVLEAAYNIKNLASSMTADDILFVLISGGGSALLPMPRGSISLTEKMHLIQELANRGATIEEMNVVRIAISEIKGGQLAAAARNAFAVISFVISDIIDDPLDLIASGPTYKSNTEKFQPKAVLEKFELWDILPLTIKDLIENPPSEDDSTPASNNYIHIIGSNKIAVKAAAAESFASGYNPIILSTSVKGEVQEVVKLYSCLIENLKKYQMDRITIEEFRKNFPFPDSIFNNFFTAAEKSKKTKKPLLLIFGGEPTVKVIGNGIGGRNQELALRIGLESIKNNYLKDVCFLSAGTDGIDGPTPVAGAIGCQALLEECGYDRKKSILTLENYINRNDSYSFYHNFTDELFYMITGHTGTNVMDLHLLTLMPPYCNKQKSEL